MYRLIITDNANADLDEIVQYISEVLKNKKAASDFIDEVLKCYSILAETPKIYAPCNEPNLSFKGYRKTSIKNYLVIYSINDKTNTVTILRFFYGARDYIKLL